MDFRLTFKNMHHSQALAGYAQEKLGEKIEKYVPNPIEAHVTFSIDGKDRVAQCQVFARERFNVQVEARGDYMLSCIDRLTDKLEARLRRQKEKMKSHHKAGNNPVLTLISNPSTFAAANAVDMSQNLNNGGEDAIDASEILTYERSRNTRTDQSHAQM